MYPNLQILKSIITEFHLYFYAFFYKKITYILFFIQFFFKSFAQNSIPVGLSNNIAAKHPLLLLLFYINFTKSNKFFLWNCFFIFYLGSLWASCEFNWGGFWSFDFVENTILFFFFLKFFFFHINFKKKKFFIFFHEYIFFFLFLKFLPVNSIHSFNNQVKCFYFVFLMVFSFIFKKKGRIDFFLYFYIIYYLSIAYKTYVLSLLFLLFFKKFWRYFNFHKKIFYILILTTGILCSTYNYLFFLPRLVNNYRLSLNSKNLYIFKKNLFLYKLNLYNYSLIYYSNVTYTFDSFSNWFNYIIM